jgi:hypothetical protein
MTVTGSTSIYTRHHSPKQDNSFDLGTVSLNWRNVYANNLYIGGVLVSLASHITGTSNYFAGTNAGNPSLSGATDNVGVGYDSLKVITSGDFNTCSGSGSGASLTSAIHCTLVGYNNGSTLTTNGYHTSVGSSNTIDPSMTGKSAIVGYNNSVSSGATPTTIIGSNNSVAGGTYNIGITESIAFGTFGSCVSIGFLLTVGNTSTNIGTGSSTGSTGTALGRNSTSGAGCVSVGDGNSSTGTQSTSVGNGANADGIGSTSYGFDSLAQDYSVAFGHSAYVISGATKGCAFGYNAVVFGTGCISIGYSALCLGADAIAIGNDITVTDGIGIGGTGSISGLCIGIGHGVTNSTATTCVIGSPTMPIYTYTFGRGTTASSIAFTSTFNVTSQSGTNITGNPIRWNCGGGTGSAVGGSFFIGSTKAGTSGTTLNSLVDVAEFHPNYLRLIDIGLRTSLLNQGDSDLSLTLPNYSDIVYTSLSTGRTVNLPPVTGLTGYELTIIDGTGSAGSNNITVDGNGSETINGSTTYVINTNYGTVTLKCNGTGWFVKNKVTT